MKKLILLLSLIIITIGAYSQATTGTRVTAPIVPNDSGDVYATHDAFFGRDGYRSVTTLAQRDSVKPELRKEGMQVYVKEDSSIYQLRNGISNGNWFKLISTQDTTSEWVSRTIYVSMPNDPQTPGSDVTGNGTSLLPFATILKALQTVKSSIKNGAIITFQLDSGSFNYGFKEYAILNSIKVLSGVDGSFTFKGQLARVEAYPNSLTLAQDANDRWKFTCSNYTFTPNSLIDYGLSNSINGPAAPIESNTTNVIKSLAFATSWNILYRYNTHIIPTTTTTYSSIFDFDKTSPQYTVDFQNMVIDLQSTYQYYLGNIRTWGVLIKTSNNSALRVFGNKTVYLGYTSFLKNMTAAGQNALFGAISGNVIFYSTLIKNTNTIRYGIGVKTPKSNGLGGGGNNLWIVGFTSAISDYTYHADMSFDLLKVSNCTNLVEQYSATSYGAVNLTSSKIIVDSVDYLLFTKANLFTCTLIAYNNTGNVRLSLFNPSSVAKDLVSIHKGTDVYWPNTYPEIQQKITFTLANNSTDSISIADKSYNRAIELKYTITRGSDYRTGTLKVLNTGTSLLFDPGDYIETSDIGVTFNGSYYSGSSNIIKLKWTTTNTGTAATIVYDAYRQNY